MSDTQQLVQTIKQWIELETKISSLSRELREIRKEKKSLSVALMGVMKENEIDCFDCNNGQLAYTKNTVKKAINKKYLSEVLDKYFDTPESEEASALCNFILENRDVEIRENIKLKKKK